LASREITALLGNNGAGKTTLIKILLGDMPFDSKVGDVIVNDESTQVSLKREPKRFRSFIRFCPQDDILIPELSVKEHLELSFRLAGFRHSSQIKDELNRIA